MSLNLYDTRQLALLNPTDLRTHGKALLAANQNIGGTGSEKEAIVRAWTEFATVLFPEVASELVAMDCNGILSSSGHPFNQDEENSKFQSKIYWNTCMATMPKESTFRAEINSLISTMQWHHTNLKRNKSLYGECYLVGWMLHHMSEPVSNFLKWSLEKEEFSELEWTIMAAKEHLYIWAEIFQSSLVDNYIKECREAEARKHADDPKVGWAEKYLYNEQRLAGGGPRAHFLCSRPEHRRFAYQMFKTAWRDLHESYAGRLNRDSEMTG